jgi:hypothetical protein
VVLILLLLLLILLVVAFVVVVVDVDVGSSIRNADDDDDDDDDDVDDDDVDTRTGRSGKASMYMFGSTRRWKVVAFIQSLFVGYTTRKYRIANEHIIHGCCDVATRRISLCGMVCLLFD